MWTATAPDTFSARLNLARSLQGLLRVTVPAAGLLVDPAGRYAAVLTLDQDPDQQACAAAGAQPPPLVFEFLLAADCLVEPRLPPFTSPDRFFRRQLPRVFASDTFRPYAPRFIGEIIGEGPLLLA